MLTPLQARPSIEGGGGHRLKAMSGLAVTFGLRQGELLGLRWRNVDLDIGRLSVTGVLRPATADG